MLSNGSNVTTRSFENDHSPHELSALFFTLHTLTTLCIYIGNILTIVAFVKFKQLQTVTNIFTVSLSCSDLLTAIILPCCCILNHTSIISSLYSRKVTCLTCSTFWAISQWMSMLNLMAIAIDRYLAVYWPLRYRNLLTPFRAGLMLAMFWTYIVTSTLVLTWGFNMWRPTTFCTMIKVHHPEVYIGFYITNILLTLTVTICLHLKVFKVAREQANQIDFCNGVDGIFAVNRKTVKVSRMMTLVLSVFLVCWLPYTILNISRLLLHTNSPTWLDIAYKLSASLLYANSFMNPVIYGWKNKTFRFSYIKILTCNKKYSCGTQGDDQAMSSNGGNQN